MDFVPEDVPHILGKTDAEVAAYARDSLTICLQVWHEGYLAYVGQSYVAGCEGPQAGEDPLHGSPEAVDRSDEEDRVPAERFPAFDGPALLSLRQRLQWTQVKMGEVLGVSGKTISDYENGHKDPPSHHVAILRQLREGLAREASVSDQASA